MKTKRRNFSSSSCFHFHNNKQHQNRGDHPQKSQSFVKLQNSSDHQMRASSHNNRTLLDIIRDEESGNAYKDLVDRYANTKNQHHHRKSIKDRLRIRRSSSAKTTSSSSSSVSSSNSVNSPLMAASTQPVPASDIPLPSKPQFQRAQSSVSFRSSSRRDWNPKLEEEEEEEKTEQSAVIPPKLNAMSFRSCSRRDWNPKVEAENDDDDDDDDEEQETEQSVEEENDNDDEDDQDHEETEQSAEEENVSHEDERIEKGNFLTSLPKDQPPTPPPSVTVSLLDLLLEETDTQAAYIGTEEEEDEEEEEEEIRKPEVVEEEEEEEEWEEGSGVYVCCVCMVRHKGAAFIPCGHTFCRKCSRELWASRGNCPLCNGYILEILNIF